MGTFILVLVIAVIVAGVWWNHRIAAEARTGVSFVLPHPPSVVHDAVNRAHNQGAVATLRNVMGGVRVEPLGGGSFATSTKLGDQGEISVSSDASGSRVSARTLNLYVGSHPSTRRWAFAGIVHGVYRALGIAPGAGKMKGWQGGLERRVRKALTQKTV
jgi:hypothetical protein